MFKADMVFLLNWKFNFNCLNSFQLLEEVFKKAVHCRHTNTSSTQESGLLELTESLVFLFN